MKVNHIIYLLASGLLLLAACTKEAAFFPDRATPDPMEYANNANKEYDAVVTVLQTPDQVVYFQVDATSRLYPLNYSEPYTGPKRLACRLLEHESMVDGNPDYHYGAVVWSEEVMQGAVVSSGDNIPDDGLTILDDWMTSLEDAFLTLHYSTFWGDGTVSHRLVLVNEGDGIFRLRHSRNGDEALREGDALVCFDLNSHLPRTEGMDITLKWTTGAGESTEKSFRFRSRP